MQKSLLIAVIIIVVAAGGLFFFLKKGAQAPSGAETLIEQPADAGKMAEKSSVVSSIKDAMGLNKKMACTYSSGTGEGSFTSTVYTEGSKFKTTTEVNGAKTNALFDGETQYVWTEGQSQGFKMTRACLDELKDSLKNLPAGTEQPADYEKSFDAAENVRCEEAGAVDFSVPANVTFADQCAMMRQSMDAMKQIQGQMPQGMTLPSGN